MDKTKYIKWYRLAQEIVKNDILIPDRTDEQIIDLVSQEDWLMFTPKDVTREQAKNSNDPNIWFTIDKDSTKLFKGESKENEKDRARIGLTFNTIPSVEKIKNILSGYCKKEKEELIKQLLTLEGVWKIKVKRKIKEHNFAESPTYIEEYKKDSNQIDGGIVDEVIKVSNRIRKEGDLKREEFKIKDKFYLETPSIELMECDFALNEQEYQKRIKEAFEVLAICLNVKTDSEIKKFEKEKKKREKSDREIDAILAGF